MKKLFVFVTIVSLLLLSTPIFAQCCATDVTTYVSPETIDAGDTIHIHGRVTSTIGCDDPEIKLYLDGDYIGTTHTDEEGYYEYYYQTSCSISTGWHYIRAVSKVDCCEEDSDTDSFYAKTRPCECECESCHELCDGDCRIHISIETPRDVFVGDMVEAKIEIENYGGSGYVTFDAYMCRADGSDCKVMDCDGDPRVYIRAHDSEEFTCSIKARKVCSHKIKVVYYGCNADPVVYSNIFEVKKAKCEELFLNEYMCVNDWRMRKYQLKDCSNVWKKYEFCTYGCVGDKCAEPPVRKIIPIVSIEPHLKVKSCEISNFSFKVENIGDKRGELKLFGTGKLAEWIFFQPTVNLNVNEEKTITAHTSIPCDVTGTYVFTIKALGDEESSTSSYLSVSREEELPFSGYFAIDFLWKGFIFVAFIVLLILLFKRRIGYRKRPESFKEVK